jgi:hypothetical protein
MTHETSCRASRTRPQWRLLTALVMLVGCSTASATSKPNIAHIVIENYWVEIRLYEETQVACCTLEPYRTSGNSIHMAGTNSAL